MRNVARTESWCMIQKDGVWYSTSLVKDSQEWLMHKQHCSCTCQTKQIIEYANRENLTLRKCQKFRGFSRRDCWLLSAAFNIACSCREQQDNEMFLKTQSLAKKIVSDHRNEKSSSKTVKMLWWIQKGRRSSRCRGNGEFCASGGIACLSACLHYLNGCICITWISEATEKTEPTAWICTAFISSSHLVILLREQKNMFYGQNSNMACRF